MPQDDLSPIAAVDRALANGKPADEDPYAEANEALAGPDRSKPVASLELIDWATVHDERIDVLDGLIIAGRWTAIAAGPKVGKSTLLVAIGTSLSLGWSPFDGTAAEPVTVLHLDAELGRLDLDVVVRDCGHDPRLLDRWHACDIPPRLDTIDGAAIALVTARDLDARLVIVDGINGTVSGAEKDDTPWRDLFDRFIRPLKADGRAVVTTDNTGHENTNRPRGSSVKLDKPDCIVALKRTQDGVRLTATHRRSSEYAEHIDLDAVGFDGTSAVTYRRAFGGWVAGAREAAAILDQLGLPPSAGRPAARAALAAALHQATKAGDPDADRFQVRNDVLASAIRWRKTTR